MYIKKIISFFVFVSTSFIFLNSSVAATPQHKRNAILETRHPRLRHMIAQMRQLPEANRVIDKALQGGTITLELSYRAMPFEAMWESTSRRIVLDGIRTANHGRMLCNLLFELHNAASEPLYQKLYRQGRHGLLDCDTYVEAVERIEYNNMIHTADIVERGIRKGLLPTSARWEIVRDFDTHYKIQQLTGHSLQIVQEFNRHREHRPARAYHGTVRNRHRMGRREREWLAAELYTRHRNRNRFLQG